MHVSQKRTHHRHAVGRISREGIANYRTKYSNDVSGSIPIVCEQACNFHPYDSCMALRKDTVSPMSNYEQV